MFELLALLARLQPTAEKRAADLLREIPSRAAGSSRWVAVLLDERSRREVQEALPEGAEIETHVVTEPGFEQIFRLQASGFRE